jgi:murein DD-endopeptidase MepM/ murein hydrolase activator NlpD
MMPAVSGIDEAAGAIENRQATHVPKPRPGPASAKRDIAALRALIGRDRAQPVALGAREDRFAWPVRGYVLSAFGRQPNGSRNDGIDIAAAAGTAVLAAERGTVVYAGSGVSGYGMTLLVRHRGDYTTVYAHASDLLVNVGDDVARGQAIARLGGSGSSPPVRLHFQLRAAGRPVDPAAFLARDETVLASNVAR